MGVDSGNFAVLPRKGSEGPAALGLYSVQNMGVLMLTTNRSSFEVFILLLTVFPNIGEVHLIEAVYFVLLHIVSDLLEGLFVEDVHLLLYRTHSC